MFDVCNLILCDHVSLLKHLDRIIVAGGFLFGQKHRAERAFADWLNDLEVFV